MLRSDDVQLESVLITEELDRRAPHGRNISQVTGALQDLAREMIDDPADVLPRLVDLALDITDSVSGGISLFKDDPHPGIFRWHYLRGNLSAFNGATTPRNYSPCGKCLDLRKPVLVRRPERYYSWLVDADVSLPECLLVPLYVGSNVPLGTLWVVSEDEEHFHREHASVLTELSTFTGMALHMLENQNRLQQTLRRQENLTHEMKHRVKNLLSMIHGMVGLSARRARTPEDMASMRTGRLKAIGSAIEFVLARSHGESEDQIGLANLIRAVVRPHTMDGGLSIDDRFKLSGPWIELGDAAATSLALVFHELATNATKYGALSADGGSVRIKWDREAEHVSVVWKERGGPPISEPPLETGFGTKLIESTVCGQLDGDVTFDWQTEGLVTALSIPLAPPKEA